MERHKIKTLGDLRASGYQTRSVREEIRKNLLKMIQQGEPLFEDIHGYDETVIPALVNALLAKHDILLLGLRGQAKSRILRKLTRFLDPFIPYLEGTPTRDDPFRPISPQGKRMVKELGDEAPIAWLSREERYGEKLATPDITVADLLGDIDPIKAATQRRTLDDPEVIHFGLIPRFHRGIFCINELPDLSARLQVSLFNILEEQDIQLRGFPIRLPLDILMVFTANPEDYTQRGNIVTPLKDRIGSQILTHYPKDIATALKITRQEAWRSRQGPEIHLPLWAEELVEQITFSARENDAIDPTSGVSARVSITAAELLHSNLERRALITGENPCYPRLVDFFAILPALTGKLEILYEGEEKGVELVCRQIIGQAIKQLFDETFPPVKGEGGSYRDILQWFAQGETLTLSDLTPREEHLQTLKKVPGLWALAKSKAKDLPEIAFMAEVILEGLHQHLKLQREDLDSAITYKEALKYQLLTHAFSREEE